MSGFGGFGSSGGLFGAKPPDTTTASTASGLTFGSPSFGTPGTAAFGTSGTGSLAFGATSTPAFGTPNTTAPVFGSFSTGAPTFGTPATSSTAFGTGTLFGTTTTSHSFGAQTSTFTSTGSTPGAGFTFGATSGLGASTFATPTTTAAASTFGSQLNFNAPKTSSFGTAVTSSTTTTTSLTFNFGTPSTSAPQNVSFGLGQTSLLSTIAGTTSATTTTTTVTAISATTATTNATATSTSVIGAAAAITATTSQTTGFSLGSQPTTLSFNVPKTTGTLSFGTSSTFSVPSTTATSTFRFTTPTTTTGGLSIGSADAGKPGTPGLGGIDKSQLNQGLSGAGTVEPKQVKDNILPEQILQTLSDFQNFTKQQKSISVEISHGSSKPLKKVQEDTDVMESLLTMISSGLTRNALAVDKLKSETAQGLHQAEMAQRNHETPPGLDYDSNTPAEYFNDLVSKFETDTMRLRIQIEASEKHLRSLTQSTTISPQELTLAMRRLHETLVVLAARVQTLHTTVQSQKEQYRNLRRVYLKDDGAIFDKDADHQHTRKQTIFSLHSLTGPTPFSETTGSGRPLNVDGLAMLAGTTATPIISTAASQGWITPLSASTGTGSILTSSSTLQTPQPNETTGFQLSKPPTGSKRNKR